MALTLLLMPQGKKTGNLSAADSLTIPQASVTRTASFYLVNVDGTEMEVLAIRTESGEIRTAFNTCQTCYDSGKGYYAAEGEELVCQNCGFRFAADRVGAAGDGGCNPWPIPASKRIETEDSILTPYAVLADAKEVFSDWSKS
ncbi:MAG: DUF2318 domain-containing protein [Oscillospiraceae bacterium]|nr:DUF2318 domain-containing protein [Oscillospiraceae bacterium]